jgi:hypothetical protein
MKNALRIIALASSVSLQACATVLNGTTQKIGITSTPTGAEVTIDHQQRIMTPAALELARDRSHTLDFKKEGYQDEAFVVTSSTSGWVLGNVIVGGLIGVAIDLASGGGRKLSHDSVHVTLTPLPPPSLPVSSDALIGQEPTKGEKSL